MATQVVGEQQDKGRGDWFSNGSTESQTVQVGIDDKHLKVELNDGAKLQFEISSLKFSSLMSTVPLTVYTREGGILSVPYGPLAINIVKKQKTISHFVERNIFLLLPFLIGGTALMLIFIVTYVVPRSADFIATKIPTQVVINIGDQFFNFMSDQLVLDSKESEHVQARKVVKELGEKIVASTDNRYAYEFFVTIKDNPFAHNAFALPNGKIVFGYDLYTDLTQNEVAGVLAHEVAHVELLHGTQSLVSSSTLFIFGALMFDPSSILTVLPALAELSYSREHEFEADCYGVDLLQKTDIPAYSVALGLIKIRDVMAEDTNIIPGEEIDEDDTFTAWEIISTHPDFEERIDKATLCAGNKL